MTVRLPNLLQTVTVDSLKDGTLFLSCTHSIALQECHAASADLKAYLTGECHFSDIREIRISRR